MANSFLLPISIEKFAAYLDGNLPESEMEHVSDMIASNDQMNELSLASEAVSDTLEYNELLNDEIPAEIESMDFDIPDLDDPDIASVFDDSIFAGGYEDEPLVAGFNDFAVACADAEDTTGLDIGLDDIDDDAIDCDLTDNGSETDLTSINPDDSSLDF